LDFNWLIVFFQQLIDLFLQYGYVGITAISFFGNLIPFLPVPYLVAIFLLAVHFNPLLVALGVGVGATLGKCVSYLIGRGGYSLLGEFRKKELQSLSSLLGKYGAIAVYIFAALPLPDDIVVIPFGLMKYNFPKFLLALFLGKLTLGVIVAYASVFGWEIISWFVGGDNVILITAISIAFMLLMIFIIFRINWIEAAEYVDKNGVLAYIKLILSRIFRLNRGK
jgi:membrane protein YqaA with SNARE-associated domain